MSTAETQTVTPWEVAVEIDYKKLTEQFGCDIIDGQLIKRFEKATNVRAHTSHRVVSFSQIKI